MSRGRAQGRARAAQGVSGACRRRARGRSRIATSSSSPLDDWLAAVLATPGLTALARSRGSAQGAARRLARGSRARRAASRARSSTSAAAAARPGSRWRMRFPTARSSCSRPNGASASSSRRLRRRTRASSGAAPRSRRSTGPVSPSRRRSPSRRPRPSGACRSSAPGGAVVLWVGPSADRDACSRPSRRDSRESSSASPDGFARDPQDGPDAGRLSAPGRRGEEAPAGLKKPWPERRLVSDLAARLARWRRSTRLRTRRAASARRRPPSTSPRASPRPASARSWSTSTRRRTRPRGSGCARTARRPTTCSTASPLAELAKPTQFREPLPRPLAARARRRGGRARRSATTASASSPTRSRTPEGFDFVLLDCPPSLGPLTVNALAAADRVIVPVQTEYYALEGLRAARAVDQPDQGAAQSAAGDRGRAADDGRRADAAVGRGRGGGAQALRRRSSSRAVVPRSVRVAEAPSHGLPVTHYDRRSRGAEAYWKVAMELVERR